MPDDRVPTLRFGDAAYALGIEENPAPLRNWLKRGQVDIAHGFGGGWSEFTLRDLVALAIIKVLVEHNVGVEAARDLVEYALNVIWRAEFDRDPGLALVPEKGFFDPRAKGTGLRPRIYVYRTKKGRRRIDWGGMSESIDADVWLTIDVHRVLAPLIERALERIESRQPTKRRA